MAHRAAGDCAECFRPIAVGDVWRILAVGNLPEGFWEIKTTRSYSGWVGETTDIEATQELKKELFPGEEPHAAVNTKNPSDIFADRGL